MAVTKNIGTWIVNTETDNVVSWREAITDEAGTAWGTSVGTGWTPELEIRVAGTDALVATASISWEDSSDGAVLIFPGSMTALFPASAGQAIDYEAVIKLSKAGIVVRKGPDGVGTVFAFRLLRFP